MRLTCLSIGLVIGLLFSSLPAQLDVAVQSRFPKRPAKDSWYCNPDSTGKVWHFDGTQWNRLLVGDGRPPFLHQGLVWVPKGEHHALCTTTGRLIIEDADMVANNGKVFVGLSSFNDLFAITLTGDTLAYFQVIFSNRHGVTGDPLWYHQQLDGKTYDILPQYAHGSRNYRAKDVHTWGMVDAEGAWVVPPVFDEPFRFGNGVAVVKYYGQRRVINMKGEFVE